MVEIKIKENKMKKRYLLPLAGIFFIANSCRSTDTENNISGSNLNGVSFSLSEADFSNGDSIIPQASLKGNTAATVVHRQEITSGPFSITAELSPDISPFKPQAQASVVQGAMAVNKSLSQRGAVKYRIIAYKSDGTYLDQAAGDASQPDQVFFGDKLIKGETYNFVIYSLGSTVDNPPVVSNKNLNEDPVYDFTFLESYRADTADLMWAVERNVKIQGAPGDTTPPTALTTPLKHIFTRVNIMVDNSDATGTQKGGYLSENTVNATIKSTQLYSLSSFNLNTGTITNGETYSSGLKANNLTAAAQTYIVNTAGAANSTLSISVPAGAIKVGNDVNPKPVVVNFDNGGTGLQPGYSYTLKLRFNSDRYINEVNETKNAADPDAVYAVIGGRMWDRYNLGVTDRNPASNNPDQLPSTINLHGNYYQFGNQQPIADASSTFNYKNSNWNGNPAPGSAWNLGTESSPVKNISNDPCLPGFRVPTETELQTLLNNTSRTIIGNVVSSTYGNMNNYTAAGVYTSKKNQNVKLTIPISGYADLVVGSNNAPFQPGDIRGRANAMHIGSSTFNSAAGKISILQYSAISRFGGSSNQGSGEAQRVIGRTIRCIAE
ncbi:fimbrillin family protein [Elizabethkingia meningoseptica]|nr:fimbrillin family protein [Elizabethkingia meningoseptica]